MLSRKFPIWLTLWMATLLVAVGFVQPTPWMPATQTGVNTFTEEHDHHVAFGYNLKAALRAPRKAAKAPYAFGHANQQARWRVLAYAAPRSATWWHDWQASLPPDDPFLLPSDLRGPPLTA